MSSLESPRQSPNSRYLVALGVWPREFALNARCLLVSAFLLQDFLGLLKVSQQLGRQTGLLSSRNPQACG